MPGPLVVSLSRALPRVPLCISARLRLAFAPHHMHKEQRACLLNLIASFAKAKTSKCRWSNSLRNSRDCTERLPSLWEIDMNITVMAWDRQR